MFILIFALQIIGTISKVRKESEKVSRYDLKITTLVVYLGTTNVRMYD